MYENLSRNGSKTPCWASLASISKSKHGAGNRLSLDGTLSIQENEYLNLLPHHKKYLYLRIDKSFKSISWRQVNIILFMLRSPFIFKKINNTQCKDFILIFTLKGKSTLLTKLTGTFSEVIYYITSHLYHIYMFHTLYYAG